MLSYFNLTFSTLVFGVDSKSGALDFPPPRTNPT